MTTNETNVILCQRCNAAMEDGYATAIGLLGFGPTTEQPQLVFVVPGEPTSKNPLQAFQQGLHEAPPNEAYLLHGRRCPNCGVVELVATERR